MLRVPPPVKDLLGSVHVPTDKDPPDKELPVNVLPDSIPMDSVPADKDLPVTVQTVSILPVLLPPPTRSRKRSAPR